MSRRVFLHVGAPKTGTTYLQSMLAGNRTLLAEHGLTYPATASGSHFEAAIDLTDHRWGGQLDRARGEWDRLAASALRASADVVISHEVLAPATPEQVRRAQTSLAGTELHVVYTARDLGRQIPAEWQETVKHRGRRRFVRFLRQVTEARRVESDQWFWRVQGLPDVLSRWGAGLALDRVHLVTVPPPGMPADLLWRRFATVVGLDPDLAVESSLERANRSLDIAQITMLRKLNVSLKGRAVPQPVYAAVVRDLIARDTLGRHPGPQRATLPPASRKFVDAVTAEWVEWVGRSGIDVVGDLDELRTRWPAMEAPWVNPDRPRPAEVLEASLEALTEVVLVEAERYRQNPARVLKRRLGR